MQRFVYNVITMGSQLGKVTLINNTGEDFQMREFRGPHVVFERDNFYDVIYMKDGKSVKVDAEKYRHIPYSCEFSLLTAFCGGSYPEMEPLDGRDLVESKTITITKEKIPQDTISTEAVKYRFVVTKEPLSCNVVS